MNIPSAIKIGGHSIKVEIHPQMQMSGYEGRAFISDQVIYVNGNLPESGQSETLIHEIIEFIDSLYELKLEHEKITTISEALFQVLRDNDLNFRTIEVPA